MIEVGELTASTYPTSPPGCARESGHQATLPSAGAWLTANLSRVMFAVGRLKVAAAAVAGSWLLVIVADVVLAEMAPAHLVVAALALGCTIGQTLVAIPLVIATRRICGQAAVQGVGYAALAGLAAAAIGAAAGVAVLAAGCAVIAFGVVAYLLDHGDLRTVLARLRQVGWLRRTVRQHAA